MQTEEQRYLAATAQVRVNQLAKQAQAADEEAQRQQMTADIYGRHGVDYSDRPKAERAAREARKQRDRRDRNVDEITRIQDAAVPPKKKRGWF
ncbi:hypothetical protein ACIRJM_23020 [Streptomyces sp. NPDC102405]|uniref:hypothetical protein n=1 Tax=Streptomyces sp. NPDC102405 TaxID=3366170 RepID=UPI0038186025